jgi:D-arabinose 1-dehydrogenase-like Zn-dependent alcohol dehydrogenase
VSDPKTRRFFLGALTAASAVRVWGANDKVNVGIIGLGGRGTSHLNIYTGLHEAQVVGLCDVNQVALEKAQATLSKKNLEKAMEFEDMRQMFGNARSSVESNDSRVTPLYDAFFRLTTADLDGVSVLSSCIRIGISL